MTVFVTTSWDDGTIYDKKTNELLLKYELKGTFYISPEMSEKKIMNKEEIRKISKNNEIGAHTLSHPDLTEISLKKVYSEILNSKKILENIVGEEITSFAYPHGKYDRKVKKIVERTGFDFIRNTKRLNFDLNNPLDAGITLEIPPLSVVSPRPKLLENLKIYLLGDSWSNINKFNLSEYFLGRLLNRLNFFLSKGYTSDWKELIKRSFDYVTEMERGVWHLLGHSDGINKLDLWDDLEEIFRYISNKDVVYCKNKDLSVIK